MSRRKYIVRCRKCWENVAIVVGEDKELEKCPLCKKAETYRHAVLVGKHKKLRQNKDGDLVEVNP